MNEPKPDARMFMFYERDLPPLIPQDVMAEAMGAALNESLTAQFMKKTGQWKPGVYERPRWHVRLWRRIDRYLPRVSVHIGPRPCYRECCDE